MALHVENDPIWTELGGATDPEQFIEARGWRIPMALRFEVTNGLKLTAFLAGLRAVIEQSAPGMMLWETRQHNERSYVRITEAFQDNDDEPGIAVYYAPGGRSLIVSLNEQTLKAALDREAQPKDATAKTQALLLGESFCVQVAREVFPVLRALFGENYRQRMQLSAWSSLPILNEWKRLYPDRDPVDVHAQFWHRRLVCPGGGVYRWNEQWRTMESTVYGHPGEPKDGPALPAAMQRVNFANFGLTIEDHGLRAAVALEQQPVEP